MSRATPLECRVQSSERCGNCEFAACCSPKKRPHGRHRTAESKSKQPNPGQINGQMVSQKPSRQGWEKSARPAHSPPTRPVNRFRRPWERLRHELEDRAVTIPSKKAHTSGATVNGQHRRPRQAEAKGRIQGKRIGEHERLRFYPLSTAQRASQGVFLSLLPANKTAVETRLRQV